MTNEDFREMLRDQRKDLIIDMEKANEKAIVPIEKQLMAVNAHLRTLNGRVGLGETQGAEHGEKIRSLEREIFNRRKDDDPSGERRQLTMWEVKVFSAGFLGMAAVWSFLRFVWPILKAVNP